MKAVKDVYVLGDIHRHFGVIATWINKFEITNSIIIQVGDFGVGFFDNDSIHLINLDNILFETNNILYVIRGNHDNPSCFVDNNNVNVTLWDHDGKKVHVLDLNKAINELKNIRFLPDYSVLDINDEKWLFVGGAVSIDRSNRVLGQSYFYDEKFVFDIDRISEIFGIDRVVTHSSPDFCPPIYHGHMIYSYAQKDNTLVEDLKYERSQISSMFTELKKNNNIKSWYYGHFHNSSIIYNDSTEFICLNINEFKQVLGRTDYE